jgi:hypothetical protein
MSEADLHPDASASRDASRLASREEEKYTPAINLHLARYLPSVPGHLHST